MLEYFSLERIDVFLCKHVIIWPSLVGLYRMNTEFGYSYKPNCTVESLGTQILPPPGVNKKSICVCSFFHMPSENDKFELYFHIFVSMVTLSRRDWIRSPD